jgi:hypothetical protein
MTFNSSILSLLVLCSIIIAFMITTWENQWQQSGDSTIPKLTYTMPQSMR